MACPWQADFNECASQTVIQPRAESKEGDPVPGNTLVTRTVWWWPAQRPSFVWVRDGEAPKGKKQVPWVGSADPDADDYVSFANDLEMVRRWHDLAFLYDFGTAGAPDILEVGSRLRG
jgi:hypothetical protein